MSLKESLVEAESEEDVELVFGFDRPIKTDSKPPPKLLVVTPSATAFLTEDTEFFRSIISSPSSMASDFLLFLPLWLVGSLINSPKIAF